jgi:hypothetical protein
MAICIHPLPQFLSRLEVRGYLFRNLNRLAGLWIPANPGFAVIQGKASKAANLNMIAMNQGISNGAKNDICSGPGVGMGQDWNASSQAVDKISFGDAGFHFDLRHSQGVGFVSRQSPSRLA